MTIGAAIGRRAILAGVAGAAASGTVQAQAPTTLRVFTGGQQRPDVMRRILDLYQERTPGVRVEIEIGGAPPTSSSNTSTPSWPAATRRSMSS